MKRIGRSQKPVSPTTAEPDYDEDDFELMMAVEKYKRINGRKWPSLCEVLAVLKSLDWRKIAPAKPLPGYKAEECGR